MLVAYQCVNRASWAVAEGVIRRIRARWSDPASISTADVWEMTEMTEMLRSLGFVSRRPGQLIALAVAWVDRTPVTSSDVITLPGCGRYAADSWAIFVEGRRDVDPTDGKLRWFLVREAGLV